MGSIRFYTIEDWVEAYLKEWGYTDVERTATLTAQLKKEKGNLHPDDISRILNAHILDYINNILLQTGLSDIQKLNYFKMVFLEKELYRQINLFEQISAQDELILIQNFQNQLYQVAPDLIQANMFRQSIKTFHPFWKIKKTFAKGIKGIKMVAKSVGGK